MLASRLGAQIDGNGTAQEVHKPAVCKTCSLHHSTDAKLTWIVLDRFGDITIDVRVPMQQPAQRRSCRAQISKISPAIKPALRLSEIQRQEESARFQHAKNFMQQPWNL